MVCGPTQSESHHLSTPIELRDLALKVARSVASEIRRQAGIVCVQATKSTSTDLVTRVDRWSEKTIVEALLAARPNDSIVGEEGTGLVGTSDVRWVVDPIDGTTNFVYGHPGFSVSIAAELAGQPVAGVIVDPLAGDEFCAARGSGATRNGNLIRVSDLADPALALVATGFSYDPDRRRQQAEVLVGFLPHIRDVRRMGGAAVDLASVACGRVDAFYEEGLNHWDRAAGVVLVTEAGGRITDVKGFELVGSTLETASTTVAAPPRLHDPLLALINEARIHDA